MPGMASADWEDKRMAAWQAWSTLASLALCLSFLSHQPCCQLSGQPCEGQIHLEEDLLRKTCYFTAIPSSEGVSFYVRGEKKSPYI